jgi:putative ABC transport system permease protein
VIGLYDTNNSIYDDNVAFVHISSLNALLGKQNIGHETLIYLNQVEDLDTSIYQLNQLFPDLLIQSYKQISPELELFESQIGMAGQIYMVIFMLALIFGIINTMLMAVLERIRELGMLMSVGMNKIKVFSMIVFETVLLGFVGAPIGILFGYLMTNYFSVHGLNLTFFGEEGMQQFGMSSFIYPVVNSQEYINLAMAVFITALLASLYPAYKAIRLKPVEAIRKI